MFVVYFSFDQVVIPDYELLPMGTMAKLMVDGVVPPEDLFYDDAGGEVFTALAAVPFYAIHGANYLSLKLVPATLGLLALVGIYLFLSENFGRRSAVLGASLFALGPVPLLAKWSLIASGNHFEDVFFLVLLLWAFYRLHRRGPTSGGLFRVGLIAGLELFIFLGAIIPIGLVAGFHLGVQGWRRSFKDLRWLVPGFLLGSLPLIALELWTRLKGTRFLQAKFAGTGYWEAARVLRRISEYGSEIPAAAGFHDAFGIPAYVPAIALASVSLLAWVLALPSAVGGLAGLLRGAFSPDSRPDTPPTVFAQAKLVPLVLYLPLSALAYGLSGFRVEGPPGFLGNDRYYIPHFVFLVLLIAAQVGSERRLRRQVACALGVLALLIASWSSVAMGLTFSPTACGTRYPGYGFAHYARAFMTRDRPVSIERLLDFANRLKPPHRAEFLRGVGFYRMAVQQMDQLQRGGGKAVLDIQELVSGFPEFDHAVLVRGAGSFLGSRLSPADVDSLLLAQTSRHPEFTRSLLVGAADSGARFLAASSTPGVLEAKRRLLAALSPALRPDFIDGLGRLCGRLLRREISAETVPLLNYPATLGLSQAEGRGFYCGVGRGLAEDDQHTELPRDLVGHLPEEDLREVLGGLAQSPECAQQREERTRIDLRTKAAGLFSSVTSRDGRP